MKTKKKLLSALSIVCAFAIIFGGVFAFFSDSASLSENTKVGTVNIDVEGGLIHSNALNNLNPGDNDPDVPEDYRSGTDHELSFEIDNLGNKSVVYRTVIEVSAVKNNNAPFTAEELMSIILSEKQNITTVTTQENITSTDTDKYNTVNRLNATGYDDNKLVYVVGGTTENGMTYVLNGTGEDAETETNVTTSSTVQTFDVGLDKDVSEELFEGAIITFNVKVQAMQYRNTGDAEWNNIFEKSYTTEGMPEAVPALSTLMVTGMEFNPTVPENTATILFTDEKAPDGTILTDLSVAQDMGVVSWLDGTTYKVSSQRSGVTIAANEDCSWMFQSGALDSPLANVKSINLTNLDTSNTTNMSYMFSDAYYLESIIFSDNFDTSKVTDMNHMFSGTSLKSLTLPDSFNTSNITTMHQMFAYCSNLTNLSLPENFDTSKVTDMSHMFSCCYSLNSLDISTFNTKNVTDMSYMFNGCWSFNSLDLSTFNTENVVSMEKMFVDCYALENIILSNNFNTSKVINMIDMFRNCNLLTLNCSNWNVTNVTDRSNFNTNATGVTAPTWIN